MAFPGSCGKPAPVPAAETPGPWDTTIDLRLECGWDNSAASVGWNTFGAEAAEPLLCELFDLPQLRTSADPPEPTTVRVSKPLSLPRELAENLRITTPGDNETFIACGESAIIHASANHDEGNQWFLNGKLEGSGKTQRLILPPGVYELRCVDQHGSPSTVRFTVHPSVATQPQNL